MVSICSLSSLAEKPTGRTKQNNTHRTLQLVMCDLFVASANYTNYLFEPVTPKNSHPYLRNIYIRNSIVRNYK